MDDDAMVTSVSMSSTIVMTMTISTTANITLTIVTSTKCTDAFVDMCMGHVLTSSISAIADGSIFSAGTNVSVLKVSASAGAAPTVPWHMPHCAPIRTSMGISAHRRV